VSKEEERDLRELFKEFDEDGNGVLSRDELLKGITKYNSRFGDCALLDIDEMIKRIDIDGSGTIDIKEFITATINL